MAAAVLGDPGTNTALALTILSVSAVLFVCIVVAAVLYGIDYKKSKDAAPGTPFYDKWYFSYTFRIIVSIGLGILGVVTGIAMLAAIFYLAPKWSEQRKADVEWGDVQTAEKGLVQDLQEM